MACRYSFSCSWFLRGTFAVGVMVLASSCGSGGGGGVAPDKLAFEPAQVDNAAPGLHYLTSVTISNIDAGAERAVAAQGGALMVNGVEQPDGSGTVKRGDELSLRVRAPDTFGQTHVASVTIGDETLDFALATPPAEFAFKAVPGGIELSWGELAVTAFNILANADGASGFAPVAEGVAGDATRHVLPVDALHIDWERARYAMEACLSAECVFLPGYEAVLEQALSVDAVQYVKAVPGEGEDHRGGGFGRGMDLSADGSTLAATVFMTADESEEGEGESVVQVFRRTNGDWSLETTLRSPDGFGGRDAVSLSADGRRLAAVGDSKAHVFHHDGAAWQLEETFASTAGVSIASVQLAGDGRRLLAGSDGRFDVYERTDADGWLFVQHLDNAGGNIGDKVAASEDGRVLVMTDRFQRTPDGGFRQGAVIVYFDADGDGQYEAEAEFAGANSDAEDGFGTDVAVSADGRLLVVGARIEDANLDDPDSNGDDAPRRDIGAVYVFERAELTNDWMQIAYLKAPNGELFDQFGSSVALSGDGHWLAVSANGEQGAGTGVHAADSAVLADNTGKDFGAVYLYERTVDGDWAPWRYVKRPVQAGFLNFSNFGAEVRLSADGRTLIVNAPLEAGAGTGVNEGDLSDVSAAETGAIYIY